MVSNWHAILMLVAVNQYLLFQESGFADTKLSICCKRCSVRLVFVLSVLGMVSQIHASDMPRETSVKALTVITDPAARWTDSQLKQVSQSASHRDAKQLSSVRPDENKSTATSTTLPEITVPGAMVQNSPNDPRYIRTNATTATRTNTPVMETPFSVQIVPGQVLRDRQSFRLQDALQNVSGVTFSRENVPPGDSFNIRGFATNAYYRNGVFIPFNTGVEMANIEQIEVLKGPGSILFGRADPGGIINVVTKQALSTSYYSLQQQTGNFDFYRTAIDATGPITRDAVLLYRMNLSYENSRSFRDFDYRKSVFFAPSFTWHISPRTQITAEMEYQSKNMYVEGGIVALGDRPAPIPRSRTLDEPSVSVHKSDRYFGGINWSHQFNDNWKIMNWLSLSLNDVGRERSIVGFSAAQPVDTPERPFGTIDRFFVDQNLLTRNYQSMLNLVGNVTTGKLHHTLLFGYDYFHSVDGNKTPVICCPSDSINIFNHTHMTDPLPPNTDPSNVQFFRDKQSWHGAYFQDQVKLPFNLHVMGGFRYDNAINRDTVTNTTTGKDDRFSPRGGLLWRPMEWLSVYGSYTENFGVSNGFDVDRKKLPPQTAQQWEMGIKTEFFDGRLRSTFSYFELTKQNIAIRDPINPFFSKAIGEAETRGIEIDIAGEVLPGWNMIATYSYLPFAKITKDNSVLTDDDGSIAGVTSGNQGNRLFGAAAHTGSYWNTYEFRNGALRGLKLGGGIQGIGERQGDAENSFHLPAFVIGNLMASYRKKLMNQMHLTAQLNVHNVSSELYYASAAGAWYILPGAPRTYMGSLRIDY